MDSSMGLKLFSYEKQGLIGLLNDDKRVFTHPSFAADDHVDRVIDVWLPVLDIFAINLLHVSNEKRQTKGVE